MRGDEEMGTIIATQIIKEEGTSGDGDANAGGESGSGESGRAGECGEYRETVLEVHQALGTVHQGHQWGPMQKLPSKKLRVFTHATEGVRWG